MSTTIDFKSVRGAWTLKTKWIQQTQSVIMMSTVLKAWKQNVKKKDEQKKDGASPVWPCVIVGSTVLIIIFYVIGVCDFGNPSEVTKSSYPPTKSTLTSPTEISSKSEKATSQPSAVVATSLCFLTHLQHPSSILAVPSSELNMTSIAVTFSTNVRYSFTRYTSSVTPKARTSFATITKITHSVSIGQSSVTSITSQKEVLQPTYILVVGGTCGPFANKKACSYNAEVLTIPPPNGNMDKKKTFIIDNLTFPMEGHRMIRDQNDRVMMIGGFSLGLHQSNRGVKIISDDNGILAKLVDGAFGTLLLEMSQRLDEVFGKWVNGPQLIKNRHVSAVTMTPDHKVWVTGGFFGGGYQTEVLRNGTFDLFVNLKVSEACHTFTKVPNTNKYVLLGGNYRQIYIYDYVLQKWTKNKFDLGEKRCRHLSFYDEKQDALIVAGGYKNWSLIMDLKSGRVRRGPIYPRSLENCCGCVIKDRYGRIFLLGCNSNDGTVVQYKNRSFTSLDKPRMKTARDCAACVEIY